jgi:DNA ligase (NAD+)
MNIDSIGPETVELLFSSGLIKNIADLYTIEANDLLLLPRMGIKSAENIINSVRGSLNVPFERVLFALGIRFVGATVAKRLARTFVTIDNLMDADVEKLITTDEIGERIAGSVVDFFARESNRELIARLKAAGLKFTLDKEVVENKTDKLKGKSIVISGVFEKHSRDEYKEIIEKNGGKNVGSVSKSTSFILAGANMGPSKLEKAQKLGVVLVSEDEFLSMLD